MFSRPGAFQFVGFDSKSKRVMDYALYMLSKFSSLSAYVHQYVSKVQLFEGTAIPSGPLGTAYISSEAFEKGLPEITQEFLALFYLLVSARAYEQARQHCEFHSRQAAMNDSMITAVRHLQRTVAPTLRGDALSYAMMATEILGATIACAVQQDLRETVKRLTDTMVATELAIGQADPEKRRLVEGELAAMAKELASAIRAEEHLTQRIGTYKKQRDGSLLMEILAAAE